MPAEPSHYPDIRNALIPLIAISLISICFTCSAEAQTTWLVLVDVSSGNDTPTYLVSPQNADTCDPSHKSQGNNGDVYVCPNDTVLWMAKSKQDNQTKMQHHHLIIAQEDGILVKTPGSDPIHIFHAHEGGRDGGAIYEPVPPDGPENHEYSVFVFDKVANYLYVDDPKIIIGGTRLETELARLEKKLALLLVDIAEIKKQLEALKKPIK